MWGARNTSPGEYTPGLCRRRQTSIAAQTPVLLMPIRSGLAPAGCLGRGGVICTGRLRRCKQVETALRSAISSPDVILPLSAKQRLASTRFRRKNVLNTNTRVQVRGGHSRKSRGGEESVAESRRGIGDIAPELRIRGVFAEKPDEPLPLIAYYRANSQPDTTNQTSNN